MNYRNETTGVKGVHLVPGPHQGGWMLDPGSREYHLKLLADMGIEWVTMLTSGDSCLAEFDGRPAVVWLLNNGQIPIIRDYREDREKLPRLFNNQTTVARLAEIYSDYDLVPLIQLWNEPNNHREWKEQKVPRDWWEQFVPVWCSAADVVLNHGGLPGFPDGDGAYDFHYQHPFRDVPRDLWERGAWYATHAYGKGRPVNYPRDRVSRLGIGLTEGRYSALLDDFADDPAWREDSLLEINAQRQSWAKASGSYIDDDTCWWRWRAIQLFASDILGFYVPQAVTECGWVPRDRASGMGCTDIRWPLTTPKRVAKKTVRMFRDLEKPYNKSVFAATPWIFNSPEDGAWADACWVGGAFYEQYGYEKPVAKAMVEANVDRIASAVSGASTEPQESGEIVYGSY